MTDVPIRPALIVWARVHRGLSEQEAADKLNMPLEKWNAFESGEETPNISFFKSLSGKLKIPRGSLLRATPPNVPPMPQDFRNIEGREPTISFETRLAIDYARTMANNVIELVEEGLADPLPVLPRITLDQNPSEAGEAERDRLGISYVQQLTWTLDDSERNWRTVIEGAGTYILVKKFPTSDCKGFTIFDHRDAPFIVLTKSEPLEVARIFTILHEYCHLLLRQPGLSDLNNSSNVEAYCNKFAAGFLMPRGLIRQIIGAWPDEPREWDIGQIRTWARSLRVSQQALSLRLETLGLAPAGFYNRVKALQGRAAPRTHVGGGGNYNNTQVHELGNRLTGTVLNAERLAAIKPFEAAEILSIKPKNFEVIRERIRNQSERITVG